MRNIKILIILLLIVAIIGSGVYFIRKGKSEQDSQVQPHGENSFIDEGSAKRAERDNRRIVDLNIIGRALIEYSKNNANQYPKTNGIERISNGDNFVFKTLKNGRYLDQLYKDPISEKYYYGYDSNGSRFDLSAVLEDKNDARCSVKGNICIYKFTSEQAAEMMSGSVNSNEEFYFDNQF